MAGISIHAPREGGDSADQRGAQLLPISIHAPREGGDYNTLTGLSLTAQFQSTPPARGATGALFWRMVKSDISIHAPREGGDEGQASRIVHLLTISIHAPREGGDSVLAAARPNPTEFQSTPPARGATNAEVHIYRFVTISIHAPREGGRQPVLLAAQPS